MPKVPARRLDSGVPWRTWGPYLSFHAIGTLIAALVVASATAAPLGPDGDRGRMHPGKVVWLDLATEDPAAAKAFYGAVFGWRFRDVDAAGTPYTLIELGSGKVGGLVRHPRPANAKAGARWLSLISVRDVEQAARYARGHGGEVLIPPANIPGRGTHAVFRDPQGAVFGVMRASDGDPRDEPVVDGDVFWVDLFTTEPARASAFYSGVAGYQVDETPGRSGRTRWILSTDGIARAGIVAPGPKAPRPGWLPYILVDDVAATLARVRSAGGKVVVAPRADLLNGNLAVIADPQGGVIGIVDWVADAAGRSPLP
jgi:uncharacterized protein